MNIFQHVQCCWNYFEKNFRRGYMWNKMLTLFPNTFISHVAMALATTDYSRHCRFWYSYTYRFTSVKFITELFIIWDSSAKGTVTETLLSFGNNLMQFMHGWLAVLSITFLATSTLWTKKCTSIWFLSHLLQNPADSDENLLVYFWAFCGIVIL